MSLFPTLMTGPGPEAIRPCPILFRAARGLTLVPGQGIVHDFGLLILGQRILAAGPHAEVLARIPMCAPVGLGQVEPRDLGEVTLAPGLINAHAHLEMSHLKGRTASGQGFLAWIKSLVAQPLYQAEPAAMDAAIAQMQASGTVLVADIATRNAGLAAERLAASGLWFLSFHEAIGQGKPPAALPPQPGGRGRAAWAGHALYSTSGQVLARAKAVSNAAGLPFSLHLAEHDDEVSILDHGGGPFAEMLAARGIMKHFDAPGKSPVAHADSLGLLDGKTLCVHCVKVGDEDINILARCKAPVCLCPRSNEHIGVGRAPWEKLMEAGITLCLGTDSLASNQDLDLWAEVRFVKERFQGPLGLTRAVALVTREAARALGVGTDFGTLEPGKIAAFSVMPEDLFNLFERADHAVAS